MASFLFGEPFDGERFAAATRMCALDADFSAFPAADLTELGERGLKSEISSLLVDKSSLEARINSLISSRAGEHADLTSV